MPGSVTTTPSQRLLRPEASHVWCITSATINREEMPTSREGCDVLVLQMSKAPVTGTDMQDSARLIDRFFESHEELADEPSVLRSLTRRLVIADPRSYLGQYVSSSGLTALTGVSTTSPRSAITELRVYDKPLRSLMDQSQYDPNSDNDDWELRWREDS